MIMTRKGLKNIVMKKCIRKELMKRGYLQVQKDLAAVMFVFLIQKWSRRRPVVDHALMMYQLNLQGHRHQSEVWVSQAVALLFDLSDWKLVSDGRKGANIPGTRDTSAQSSTLPDFSASRPAFRQLEFDRLDNYEINCEIERLQDYGDVLPDLPENLSLSNISTPSVSLLRSNAMTPNFSSEHNDAPPAFPVLRSESSTPDLPSDNHDAPSPQNSRNNSRWVTHQGATTTWSCNPNSMKTIDFTTEQQLLVPPPTDPDDALCVPFSYWWWFIKSDCSRDECKCSKSGCCR